MVPRGVNERQEFDRTGSDRFSPRRRGLERPDGLFGAILEAAPDPILIVDGDGKMVGANSQTEVLFGYTRAELLGRPVEMLVPHAHRSAHKQHRTRYVASPHTRPMGSGQNLRGVRRDGAEVPVEISLSPLETADGTLVICIVRDVSERRRAEAEVQEARAVAEAANRAKSEFLAHMSHEIRTPMNGILGLTTLVLHSSITPQQRKHLGMVKSSAEQLLRVINDILDLSKIEVGQLEFDEAPFRLRDELDDVVQALSTVAAQRDLELTCEMAGDLPAVVIGDAGRLRQVLVNLIGNAIKFTQHGGVAVEVNHGHPPADDGIVELCFSVRDTGIGIAPEKHPSIFAPFEQGDRSTARSYGGTGLGLTISARLVERMGGRICVESTVGHGSTFSFAALFRRGEDSAALDAPPARPHRALHDAVAALSVSAGIGRPLRILLAEDNLVNQELVTYLLQQSGHNVVVVANGHEALAAVERESFDLVLMDIQMPEMDGYQTTTAIRHRECGTGHHLPIVAMTAHAFARDRRQCLAAGMDGYVSKPITPETLQRAIEGVMTHMPAATGPDPAVEPERRDLPVDAARILAQLDGSREFLAQLVAAFLAEGPQQLDALRGALAAGDCKAVEMAAHRLKGSAAVFYADAGIAAANRVEELAHVGDLTAVRAAAGALELEVERLVSALVRLVENT